MHTGNIVLIGYRGSGKSTVGRLLAQRLGLDFVDTDSVIRARSGRSAAAIFAEQGEAHYRTLERAVIAELQPSGAVISIGAGAVEDPDNRARLGTLGTVIWLTADADTLYRRISADPNSAADRPPLHHAGLRAEIQQRLARRDPWYRALADWTLDTATATPAAVAERIVTGSTHRRP